MEQNNILLILCDQYRWDCLSALGHKVVDTPNLDLLAGEGSLFTNAYSPAPSCIPARASLFTGKSPSQLGFLGYRDGVDWDFKDMLPEVLRENGYQTHCVGKTHFYPQRKHCGFEGMDSYEAWQNFDGKYVNDYHEWLKEKSGGCFHESDAGLDDNGWVSRPSPLPEHLHNNTWVVTKGIEFIKRRDKTRPYFLNLSFHRPHPPVDPPKDYWDMYIHRECDEPAIGTWASKHDVPVTSPSTWRGKLSKERLRQYRLGYYAQIAHIDNQIGRFLKEMRCMGEMPDYIVFTSDHGEMLGDHNLFRKTYAYQGSAAIPLIIWEKNNRKAEVRTEAAVLQDVYTSILHQAGVPIPEQVTGLNLNEGIEREWIHGEHSSCYSDEEAMQFLSNGRYKYIWFTKTGEEQLFCLEKDPYECVDLSEEKEYETVLKECRSILVEEFEKRPCDGMVADGILLTGLLPSIRQKIEEEM